MDENSIPDEAVLLIPDPENEGDPPPFGIRPGYYNPPQTLELIEQHRDNPEAIQFIADMLETGDPEDDEFAVMLRLNKDNPEELARIVVACRTGLERDGQ